jgi:hypothetical protein
MVKRPHIGSKMPPHGANSKSFGAIRRIYAKAGHKNQRHAKDLNPRLMHDKGVFREIHPFGLTQCKGMATLFLQPVAPVAAFCAPFLMPRIPNFMATLRILPVLGRNHFIAQQRPQNARV